MTGPAGRRGRWRPIVASLLLPAAGSLPVFLVGSLSVQMQAELGFGAAGIGAAAAVFFAGAALGSAPAGRLVQRLGALPGMRLAAVIAAASMLVIAGLARSLPMLLACLAVAGLSLTGAQVGSNALIATGIRVDRQGLAFAVKQSGIPLATLLGGLAVPVFALTVGWRWAFVAAAGFALAALAVIPGDGVATASGDKPPPGALPMAPLIVVAAAGGLGAGAAGAMGSFLVVSAVDVGVSEHGAGLLLAAASAVILTTRLVMGLVADRLSRGYFELVAGMLALGAVGYLLLASGRVGAFVAGAFVAGAAGWGWPGLFNLAVVDHDRRLAAMASGVTQTGVYLGAVTAPILFGALAEGVSFPVAWLAAAVLSLASAATMLLGRSRLRRANRVPG